jgi:lysophospholipase L1-like esterase
MRTRVIAAWCVALFVLTSAASGAEGPRYYLALGDSLSIGLQPVDGVLTATNRGYADDLHRLYRLRIPGLKLAKLGCPGETTTTMMSGGVCEYPLESQLAQAVHFLENHRVAFVTLDVGANNILRCLRGVVIDQVCLENAGSTMAMDLSQILPALRAAAGPGVPIVAMNYYNPFLAAWVQGEAGQALAEASNQATVAFNFLLESICGINGVPVADVEAAFRTERFTPVPGLNVPLNVLLVLAWTWMGAPPPDGPDIHPNSLGYAVIAGAFAKKLGRPD